MFGQYVSVCGKEYLVFCTPQTSISDILRCAVRQAQEEEDKENALRSKPYRDAVASAMRGHG